MHWGSGRMGTSAPTGAVKYGVCKWGRKNIVGAGVLTGPHAGTDRRRVKDAAPYGGDENSFDIKSAAARG